MWFQLRSVELDFLEQAPRIYVVECMEQLKAAGQA